MVILSVLHSVTSSKGTGQAAIEETLRTHRFGYKHETYVECKPQ